MKAKDIFVWTNISDSGCESKIARINDILSSFALEIYDLYPRKVIERFQPTSCQWEYSPKYPVARVRGFFGKWCNVWCSLDPKDCCAWYRRLLMEELYWDNLDANSYSVEYDELWSVGKWDADDKFVDTIKYRLPSWVNDALVIYSKGFPKVKSLDDNIDIDRYTLSLLKLYMKAEYALESDDDINMSANYRSLFQSKLKRIKEMYDNSIKYVVPWALNAANQ